MVKNLSAFFIGIASLFLIVTPAFAHVIVYPNQAGVAATQDFTISVPNERDIPVVGVRLVLPSGLIDVSPNTTPGWKITTKSKGTGASATLSEIDWTNGSIPVGQREEFIFQAQVPPEPTTLAWKAYQKYSDGTVVSWDEDPAKVENLTDAQQDALADKENKGEYSTTQVINDLSTGNVSNTTTNAPSQTAQLTEILSGLALILAIAALILSRKK